MLEVSAAAASACVALKDIKDSFTWTAHLRLPTGAALSSTSLKSKGKDSEPLALSSMVLLSMPNNLFLSLLPYRLISKLNALEIKLELPEECDSSFSSSCSVF